MHTNFSTYQLAKLFVGVLSYSWRDDGGLLRVAVKACISSNKAVRDVIPISFEELAEFPDRNFLRLFFMKLGRIGMVNEIVDLLEHRSANVRFAAVHALADFGDHTHIKKIRALLEDINMDVRMRAELAVSSMSDAEYQPAKHELIAEPINHTEYIIAWLYLGEHIGVSDTPILANLLCHKNREIRTMAGQALKDHGSDNAHNLFQGLSSYPYENAQKCIEILGELHYVPIVEMLREKIESGKHLTALEINSLKSIGNHSAISVLLNAVGKSSFEIGKKVLLALAEIEPNTGNLLLESFLANSSVRSHCGKLVAMACGQAAIEALIDTLSSPFRAVRQSGEEGLMELGETAVPTLVKVLEYSRGDAEAIILRILGKIGMEDTYDAIVSRTTSQDVEIRRAAIGALAKFQLPKTIEILAHERKSSDWKVREEVARVLGSWPWHSEHAVKILDSLTNDNHPRVSQTVCNSLEQMVSLGGYELEEKLRSLVQHVVSGDETLRQEACKKLIDLKVLYPCFFYSPRLFSPEGASEWEKFKEKVWNSAGMDAEEVPIISTPFPSTKKECAEAPLPITDDVHFSVTSPRSLSQGQQFVLNVWAHRDSTNILDQARHVSQMDDVSIQSKGPVPLERDTTIIVKVSVPGFKFEDKDSVFWSGNVSNATIPVVIPSNVEIGDHIGQVTFFVGGFKIARLVFILNVGSIEDELVDVTSKEYRINSAFASYTSQDMIKVLARIQGLLKILPELDVFLDVVSLRSGENWQNRLESEIAGRDVFYLFWSVEALQSTWVDWEWRTALRTKGIECIDPIPLDTPDKAPPPPELEMLHFNDWTLQLNR